MDTNIILYYLDGDDTFEPIFLDKQLYVSIITEMELLSFSSFTNEELNYIREFLKFCSIKGLSEEVKLQTIELRKELKLKLPDAIIMATALEMDIPIISADKDFKKVDTGHLIFYEK